LSILPSPIPELQHTPLPLQSVASQGACFNSLFFRCFQFGLTFESLKELGACQILPKGLLVPKILAPFAKIKSLVVQMILTMLLTYKFTNACKKWNLCL